MSYLHCHSCDWSQDDFYSRWYNPLTKIISDIKWLWRPRMICFDSYFIKHDAVDLMKYTGVRVKFYKLMLPSISEYRVMKPILGIYMDSISRDFCFSWKWLLLEIVKDIKIVMEQKWWTYKSFKKDYDKGAVCPKCGNRNFDID